MYVMWVVESRSVQREGVRGAARRALTSEIAVRAVELFVRQGFEETTVDQIAAEVGMSTRSLFRYFPSKEDMIVGDLVELGYAVAAALRDRPPGEAPWVALRQALQVCVDSLESSGQQRAAMLATTPTLRIAMIKKHQRWQELLAPQLAERLTGSETDLRAQALVASALSCLDVAATKWTLSNGSARLGALLDLTIAAVRA